MRDYDVSVTGLGLTGLATAVAAARAGCLARGIDSSVARVNEINDITPGCGLTTTSEDELHAVERLWAHNDASGVTGERRSIDGLTALRGLAIRCDLLLAAGQPQEIRSPANQAHRETRTAWVCGGLPIEAVAIASGRPAMSTGSTLTCSGAAVSRLSPRFVSRHCPGALGTAWRKGGRGGQSVLGA